MLTTIDAAGRVVVPKPLRDALGLTAGPRWTHRDQSSVTIGLDPSAAVPLLVRAHVAHDEVVGWWAGRPLALVGHALMETYSVLTRLPSRLRAAPADAARLLAGRFSEPLLLDGTSGRDLPRPLAELGAEVLVAG